MFEKCITCDKLGKSCIPNLYRMSVEEIREWARLLKESKGWTNADLARASGVPKGTIDAQLSRKQGKVADVNYSTFAPLLCALLECDPDNLPCQLETNGSTEQVEALEKSVRRYKEELEKTETHDRESIDFLKEQLRLSQETADERKKAIVILGVLLGFTLTLIIVALIIDRLNPDIGFFWLEKLAKVLDFPSTNGWT